VALVAPALNEVAFGYEAAAPRRPEFGSVLGWLTEYVTSGAVEIVPVDARAAIVAGRLRAAARETPRARPGDAKSKARRRIGWFFDIQIAAAAWVAGYDIATDNAHDFERLGERLAELAPGSARLEVVGPPF